MKLTKTQLRKIIKEEIHNHKTNKAKRLNEAPEQWRDGGRPPQPTYDSQTEEYLIIMADDIEDLKKRVKALEARVINEGNFEQAYYDMQDSDTEEDETGFFFLEKGENQWADTSASNAFNPASFNNDPAEFAQRIMKHLDDRGRPLTFNVYNGDPFEVAKQNAVLQVINGEIIEPDTRDWDDEEGESNMLTDPEAYLEEQRAKKARPKLTRTRLMQLIEEEVIGVTKRCR